MLSLPPLPIHAGDRVCVALSGGGDSVALLRLVHAANTQSRAPLGIGLAAIHVNHGLRGSESDGDQDFVEHLCAALGVPLTVRRVETRARIEQQGETTEEAARNLRYEIFRQALADGSANVIMTAHTLDDQAETVLMKLLRGAWLEGLSAISPVLDLPGGRILRPLLSIRREALRDYLRQCKQEWREDSSNSDEAFTRNRIRKSVLPILRAENPAVDQTLANLAELAREEEARWASEMKRILPQIVLPGVPVRGGGRSNSTSPGGGAVAIELERLRALDPATRRRAIRAAARQLGQRLDFDETARLLTLAGVSPQIEPRPTVPVKAGAPLRLRGGLIAERSVRELRLRVEAPKGK
jgi:tRNA(Ile)-lysidine synthase